MSGRGVAWMPARLWLLPLLLLAPTIAPTVAAAVTPDAAAAEYLGCYGDRGDAASRALPLVQEVSPEMSVSTCLSLCATQGAFEYAGLEFGRECYCGDKHPPYERLGEERCDVPCAGGGGQRCGGALALSVYRQRSLPAPTSDSSRPLVCLVMMLKDEAHTIAHTLESVRDAVDCWTILDTGSSDATPDVVRDWFRSNPSDTARLMRADGAPPTAATTTAAGTGTILPGRMFFEPFVDYGATRNRALELCREAFNPVFTLMLSADEQVLNPHVLRSFLLSVRHASGPSHGAYPVVMHTGLRFDSVRLARVDAGWRYRARVHEYLAPPQGRAYTQLYRSPVPIEVRFNATDGTRRHDSQFYILRVLEEDLARDPGDTRSLFYLARTQSGLGNHSAAMAAYRLLSERSQWPTEKYHGAVMAAIEGRKVPGVTWQMRQEMLLEAFESNPNNMDALHALAQEHFDSNRPQLAFLFALRMVHLPLPEPAQLAAIENVLLRPTRYLYEYEGHRLLGFAARALGEWQTCVDSFRRVLQARPDDAIVRERIKHCEVEWVKQRAAGADTSFSITPSISPQQQSQQQQQGQAAMRGDVPVNMPMPAIEKQKDDSRPRLSIPSWTPPSARSPASELKRRREAQRNNAATESHAAAATVDGAESSPLPLEPSLPGAALLLVLLALVLVVAGALLLRHVCAGAHKLKV